MKLLRGTPPDINNQSIDSYALFDSMIKDADTIPTVMSLHREETPLTSILAAFGHQTKGLFDNKQVGSDYKTVGSNQVQFAVKNRKRRILRLMKDDAGNVFYCKQYPNNPGQHGSVILLNVDSNLAGPRENIEFTDSRFQAHIIDDREVEEVEDGVWQLRVRLRTEREDDYVPSDLLIEGAEIAITGNMYEHDWSTGGVERHQFDAWATEWLTLSRAKYSWSGTAGAMANTRKADNLIWATHNGKVGFLTKAEYEMLQYLAETHEYNSIFGNGTVTTDGKVLLKSSKNREVISGRGILNQNDGAYEFPITVWNEKLIEKVLANMDLEATMEGKLTVKFVGGRQFVNSFAKTLKAMGATLNNNIEGTGENKGIVDTYAYYELNGLRIYVSYWKYFDSERKASRYLANGMRASSYEGIGIPMGTMGKQNAIELVQLRPPVYGEIRGIDGGATTTMKPGPIATSVDGTSRHVLIQTGIISRVKAYRFFMYGDPFEV